MKCTASAEETNMTYNCANKDLTMVLTSNGCPEYDANAWSKIGNVEGICFKRAGILHTYAALSELISYMSTIVLEEFLFT